METLDRHDDAVAEIVLEVFAEALKLQPSRVPGDISPVELAAAIPLEHSTLIELTLHGTQGVVHRCAEALFGEPRHQLLTSEFEDAWGEIANLIAGAMIRKLAPEARLGVPNVTNRRLNPTKQVITGHCWLDVSFILGEEGIFRVSSFRRARSEGQ